MLNLELVNHSVLSHIVMPRQPSGHYQQDERTTHLGVVCNRLMRLHRIR